jgi:nicotinamide-nucleotide amidase
VLCTGGLGPTADDLTTETVAAVAGCRCGWSRRSPIASANVRRHGADHAGEQPQAGALPEGATIIPNALGTAPGFRLAIATDHGPCTAS